MGVFDAPKGKADTITIHNPDWDEGEECTARTFVRSGDKEWVLNQQMLIQMPKGNRAQRRAGGFHKQKDVDPNIKNNMGATNRLWVQKMLESWTFTMNGQPMPFEKSGQNEFSDKRMSKIMALLADDVVEYIFEQIQKAQPKEVKQAEIDEEEDEDEEGDGGSPFIESALDFIDGNAGEDDPMEEWGQTKAKSSRNFLAR